MEISYRNCKTQKHIMDASILPKVLNVLELVMQCSAKEYFKGKKTEGECQKKKAKDLYRMMHLNQNKCGYSVRNTERTCLELLVKSIGNHRYKEAAKLYWRICFYRSALEHMLFKVALVLLWNLETSNQEDCFQKFFRLMLPFGQLNKRETALEFVMCAFKCGFPDIQRQVKELAGKIKNLSILRKNDRIDLVYEAYILLLEWCKNFTDDVNVSQSQTNQEVMKQRKYDENSDIFILNLIKVMKLCNKENEIENELQRYVQSNPNNINALIYISNYLYHCDPNSDKLIYYLELLVERCVSDIRTLWLIEIWSKQGINLEKILNYCFMFLDYPTNGGNVKAWKVLWKNLKDAHEKMTEDEFQSILLLWESRKRSWSWMYFNPQHLSNMPSSDKLIAYRVAFLSFFKEGKKYVKKVSKCYPDAFQLAESLRN